MWTIEHFEPFVGRWTAWADRAPYDNYASAKQAFDYLLNHRPCKHQFRLRDIETNLAILSPLYE